MIYNVYSKLNGYPARSLSWTYNSIAGKYEGMVYSCIKRNILEIPELEL